MTKSSSPQANASEFNPDNVHWMFFWPNGDGTISRSTTHPDLPGRGTNQLPILFHLINSKKIAEADFVVVAIEIPEIQDGKERATYLANRDKVFKKLFDDFQIKTPIFITANSVKHENLEQKYFSSDFNLEKALKTQTTMRATSAQPAAAASLSHNH